MSEVYISLEDAINALKKHEDYKGYLQGDYEQILREEVKPAKVKPAESGVWVRHWDDMFGWVWECPVCGQESFSTYKFCTSCGADMRGEAAK